MSDLNREVIQAKKAKAELEPTRGMTMRMDAIGAMDEATGLLDEVIAQKPLKMDATEAMAQARDYLAANIRGAIGTSTHSHLQFQKAIEEIEEVVDPLDECPRCHGDGEVEDHECRLCKGSGDVENTPIYRQSRRDGDGE